MKVRGRTWKSDDMALLDHLEEFRWRILWTLIALTIGTVIGFVLITKFDLLKLLIEPVQMYLKGGKLKYLSPADPFMVTLRLSVAAGVVVALPVALYQLWRFLSPLLDESEKRTVLPALYGAVFLFAAGATLAYVGVLPITLRFFGSFEPGSLQQNLTVDKFLGYLMKLVLGFGTAFETPVIMLALGAMGIVTSDMLKRYRRHAIVAIFIIGAALTPPDVFSQLLMAVPLLLLFETSIWLVKWTERRRAAAAPEADESVAGEGEAAADGDAGATGRATGETPDNDGSGSDGTGGDPASDEHSEAEKARPDDPGA